jgi:hypothetical protein
MAINLGTFARTIWLEDMIVAAKTRENIFPLFQMAFPKQGAKSCEIDIMTPGTAQTLTYGTAPTLAGTGTASKVITIDQFKAYDDLVLDIEAKQTDAKWREKWTGLATETLLGTVDTYVKTKLGTYISDNSVDSSQVFASPAPVANTSAAIAAEVEERFKLAVGKLQSIWGEAGSKSRFCLLDALLHNSLVMGSSKQSPEREDLPYGYARDTANPILNTPIYNYGACKRTLVEATEYVAQHTVIQSWIVMPEVLVVAVPEMPNIDGEKGVKERTFRLCSDINYGYISAFGTMICEMQIKVLGDVTAA